RYVAGARVALERPVLGRPRRHRGQVQPLLRVDPAREVGDGDDRSALAGELVGGDTADVAEALDDAALRAERPAEPSAGPLDHHHHARARRLAAEDGPADRDRLAGDDL